MSTAYPENWFPRAARERRERERAQVMNDLKGLSTEELQRVLDRAKEIDNK